MLLRALAVVSFLGFTCQAFCDTLVPATYKAVVSAGYIDYRADSHQGSGTVNSSVIYTLNSYSSFAGGATAGPNDLGAYASIQTSSDTSGYGAGQTYSYATLVDTLHVTGPTSGYLEFAVDVNGSIVTSASGSLFDGNPSTTAYVDLSLGVPVCREISTASEGCGNLVNGTNDFLLPYLANSSGDVTLQMELIAVANCGNMRASGTNTCSADVNYYDTAQISAITVLDSNHQAIAGDYVTSLSGVNYSASSPTQPIAATPEPSTISLLGIGVMSLSAVLRKRAV